LFTCIASNLVHPNSLLLLCYCNRVQLFGIIRCLSLLLVMEDSGNDEEEREASSTIVQDNPALRWAIPVAGVIFSLFLDLSQCNNNMKWCLQVLSKLCTGQSCTQRQPTVGLQKAVCKLNYMQVLVLHMHSWWCPGSWSSGCIAYCTAQECLAQEAGDRTLRGASRSFPHI